MNQSRTHDDDLEAEVPEQLEEESKIEEEKSSEPQGSGHVPSHEEKLLELIKKSSFKAPVKMIKNPMFMATFVKSKSYMNLMQFIADLQMSVRSKSIKETE